ncbi:MAG: hypothetical protein HY698_00680 [Deltaproteobacteria bacterium]|nr:hypothetical protein [Deltaproteobacteria bacterium]
MSDTVEHRDVHLEEDVIADRKVMAVLFGTLVVSVACVLLAWVLLKMFSSWEAPARPTRPSLAKPARSLGELETSLFAGKEEMPRHVLEQQQALESYGWVNREQGVISIPVARAMDLVLERGDGGEPGEPRGREP